MGIYTKYINERLWEIAKAHLEKMDEERCPVDKIRCLQRCYTILNNCIIFCSGKKEGAGVDDIIPILIYIIIKAKLKRMVSNFNYIKALINPAKMMANHGFLISQLEMSMEYILNLESLDTEGFKVSKEEFALRSEKYNYEMSVQKGTSRRQGLSKIKK